ncbi:MAG: DUF1673 domain-containing protein [Methanoculleus sp.]|nr:DUF1673 domain-containing protein [Methanoculleus sp.]
MSLVETIRAYLGWCPMQGAMRTNLPVRPGMTAAPAGGDTVPRTGSGWWSRYHNQALVTAVAFSAAATAAFLLIEDAPGYPTVWTGLAIGAGAVIGFLLTYRRQYARIAAGYARVVAGEFTRASMTRRQRIVRRLSVPAAAVILVAWIAFFVLSGMPGWIVWFMLALSLIAWALYGVTILWERQHRKILIAEKGSMYALDAEYGGEVPPGGMQADGEE